MRGRRSDRTWPRWSAPSRHRTASLRCRTKSTAARSATERSAQGICYTAFMSDEAVFREQEGLFIPSAAASGPWGADKLHGGPVFGLLTRACERAAGDAELVATRLTFDLYRAVPMAPLSVRAEVLRQGGRLRLL